MLEQMRNSLDTVPPVDVALHVGKRLISKGDGEIGEFQQIGEERGNLLACLFKEGAQFIQVVSPRKGDPYGAQPCLEGFLNRLLSPHTIRTGTPT